MCQPASLQALEHNTGLTGQFGGGLEWKVPAGEDRPTWCGLPVHHHQCEGHGTVLAHQITAIALDRIALLVLVLR